MTRFVKKRSESSQKENSNKRQQKPKSADNLVCSYHNCTSKVVGEYTFDIDIKYKLPFCKKHKSDVSRATLWVVLGVAPLFKSALGYPTKKKK